MKYLRAAILAAVLLFCVQGICLLFVLTRAAHDVPDEVNQTRAALVKEIQDTRSQLLAEVDVQASGIRGDATGQITALRKDTMARVDTLTSDLDSRTGQAVSGVLDQTKGLRADINADLKPSLDNTAALVKDAQDSLDDSYWDIKATIESATVTTHEVALASEAIANVAPALSASAVGIGKSADGIAADAHKATSEFVKPKTKWQEFKSLLLTAARLYGAI